MRRRNRLSADEIACWIVLGFISMYVGAVAMVAFGVVRP